MRSCSHRERGVPHHVTAAQRIGVELLQLLVDEPIGEEPVVAEEGGDFHVLRANACRTEERESAMAGVRVPMMAE